MATGPINSSPRPGTGLLTTYVKPGDAAAPAAPTLPEAATTRIGGDKTQVKTPTIAARGTGPLPAYQEETGDSGAPEVPLNAALGVAGAMNMAGDTLDAVELAASGLDALDTAQDLEGITDTVKETTRLITRRASPAEPAPGGAAHPSEPVELRGAGTAASAGLTTVAGAAAVYGGAVQVADGAESMIDGIQSGDVGQVVDGAAQVVVGGTTTLAGSAALVQGGAQLVAMGRNALGAVQSAQSLGQAASNLGPLAAKLGGVASIASGLYSIANGVGLIGEPPAPEKKAKQIGVGCANVVGGALLCCPATAPLGAAILVGAAVVDNWDGICKAADVVADKTAQAAHVVGEAASQAVDKVAGGLKSLGSSLMSAFSW